MEESQQVVQMTPLSCHGFRVRLQQLLVKTGGRLVKHGSYYWLLLAEGHLTRLLFARMLGRIAGLPAPAR